MVAISQVCNGKTDESLNIIAVSLLFHCCFIAVVFDIHMRMIDTLCTLE